MTEISASDDRLVEDMRGGDPAALERIIERYAPYVGTIVWNIVQGGLAKDEVEEIVSDVFLAVWNSADKIRSGKLKGYLSVIARRRAINALRRIRKDVSLEEDELPFKAPGPEEEYLRKAEYAALRQALDEMPEPDRSIFLRHYFLYQKTPEIAESLGIHISTVQVKLWRGREKLRRKLTEGGWLRERENIGDL